MLLVNIYSAGYSLVLLVSGILGMPYILALPLCTKEEDISKSEINLFNFYKQFIQTWGVVCFFKRGIGLITSFYTY